MKEKISQAAAKLQSGIQKTSSPSISTEIKLESWGDPDCPYCAGVGYVRWDVPVGDPKFGKIELCVCRTTEVAQKARNRLYELSSLDRLSHLNFDNFYVSGKPKSKRKLAEIEQKSLDDAKNICYEFASTVKGWILLEGSYGSGKTHLAAAIANMVVGRGVPTLFITVPDLLDSLRFAYNSAETTFEKRFEDIRNADLLIMDDFGTHNATGWAQEKLFQIVNYRYINKLPTVITTNLILDEIEGRIRSRLQDDELVRHVRILALDYRHPDVTSNPGLSMLSLSHIEKMTFQNFETREDEIGREVSTTLITIKKDPFGRSFREKELIKEKVTHDDVEKLKNATHAAFDFANKPNGWLILLSPSYSGKTHLAAAIGRYRASLVGGQAIMADASVLLDYLRATFHPDIDISYNRRFYEIRTAPLLILDGLKESNTSSMWAEDKFYQLLNYRFYEDLPTVITSHLDPESFALNYPSLWNRIADSPKCHVYANNMPPYRRKKEKHPKKDVAAKKI